MAERFFSEQSDWQSENQRQLCVGLDTNITTLRQLHKDYPALEGELRPHNKSLRTDADYVLAYNRMVIDATSNIAGAYKPNRAFYEALGSNGFRVLKATVQSAQKAAPEVMNILDAKIQDIESTNEGYGKAYFDEIGFDAVTVHPYLGSEALNILTKRGDKGFLVMGRTSNKGAGELQDLMVQLSTADATELTINSPWQLVAAGYKYGAVELYKYIALRVANHWNNLGNTGLVAGATYPEESGMIRKMVGPDLFLLIPGVGAQGGTAELIVPQALRKGHAGVINSSRAIIFTKRQAGETQYTAIRKAARNQHCEIVAAQEKAA